MNKHTIELSIPEGYEVKEKEPRAPKEGEWFMDLGSKFVHKCERDLNHTDYIILRKKKPVYKTTVVDTGRELFKYVEIKALEDALEIIDAMNEAPSLEAGDCDNYKALKELVG
jgi:hypothetical protein